MRSWGQKVEAAPDGLPAGPATTAVTPVTVGVVLAAGRSERLSGTTGGHSKALLSLGGLALVDRAVMTLRRAGVAKVVVVVGFEAAEVAGHLAGTGVQVVQADDWETGNGASLAAAEGIVAPAGRFVLMCGDHLFSDGALDELVHTPAAAVLVDPRPGSAVWEEGTRVGISAGVATGFGKSLDEPAVDCGVFVLPTTVFAAARLAAAGGDHSLSGVVTALARTTAIRAVEVPSGAWWQDVDTPDDLKAARALLRRSLGKETDGMVSRKLNRPISTRITMAVAPLRLAPGFLSVATFLIGVVAAWFLSAGQGVLGGLLVQLASILDGCDGETARLQGTASRRGALLDAILDRMIDAAIFAGIGLWAWGNPSWEVRALIISLAMIGWGAVAAGLRESVERFEVPRREEPRWIVLLGGRDGRMLILAIGSVAGEPVVAFSAALATYAAAAVWRVVHASIVGVVPPGTDDPAPEPGVMTDRLVAPVAPSRSDPVEAARRSAVVTSVARVIRFLLFPVVVVGTFAVVLPRIADLEEVWHLIRSLPWEADLLLLGAAGWNLATYWPVLMASMPGLSFRQAAVVCQSSTTVAMTVPAGGAVAVGLSYAMYTSWGFGPVAIASSTMATFVVGNSVKLLLPALALVALVVEGSRVTGLASAALTGAVAVGVGVGLLVLVLRWEGQAHPIRHAIAHSANAVRGWVGRPPVAGLERRVAGFRTELVDLMRNRWRVLAATSVLSQLSVFAVLLVGMRVSGIQASEVSWAQALAVFSSVRLATAVPIIPGNVGFAELGYIGGLLLVGANSTEAVTAVLLFRFLTYFVQIPIGGVTFLAWRRRRTRQLQAATA